MPRSITERQLAVATCKNLNADVPKSAHWQNSFQPVCEFDLEYLKFQGLKISLVKGILIQLDLSNLRTKLVDSE